MRVLRSFDIRTACSLAEAKAACLVEHTQDDARIEGLIAQVTAELARRANVALVSESVSVIWATGDMAPIKAIGGDQVNLPIGPLLPANVAGVVAMLGGLDVSDKVTFTPGPRPAIAFKANHGLTSEQCSAPLSVAYTAGHGPDVTSVPLAYRTAIAAQVAWLYDGDDERAKVRAHSPAFTRILSMSGRVGISS